jgi:hypothetical protein
VTRRTRVPATAEDRVAWYVASDLHAPCDPGTGCPECARVLAEWQALWQSRCTGTPADPVEAAARALLGGLYERGATSATAA